MCTKTCWLQHFCEVCCKLQEAKEKELGVKLAIEIEPVSNYHEAEDFHQQYLSRGGVNSAVRQSAKKGCTDPIRCYG
jgi:peptide-methionine (S)-S-oxide reductase